jgi:hypothetical protein
MRPESFLSRPLHDPNGLLKNPEDDVVGSVEAMPEHPFEAPANGGARHR